MAKEKRVYTNPKSGQPLISTISSGCKTPLIEVKFCNLVNPFYYPNSPTIPRYSVTCLLDADSKDAKEFLTGIETIEKNEGVDSIIKKDTAKVQGKYEMTGKFIVKFQTKELIPVFISGPEGMSEALELEDELAKGEKIIVVYDILRYTKKNSVKIEHGLSFKPTEIYYFPTLTDQTE